MPRERHRRRSWQRFDGTCPSLERGPVNLQDFALVLGHSRVDAHETLDGEGLGGKPGKHLLGYANVAQASGDANILAELLDRADGRIGVRGVSEAHRAAD